MVSTVEDEAGEVDWKALLDLLREGKAAEIPCENERDYIRRENQIVKRAEKKGIAVVVQRGDGVLRIEPRTEIAGDEATMQAPGSEFRGDRQQERQQRREALRAERDAEREQND